MNEETEDVYIIPHNYTENGKVFGFIGRESAIAAVIWISVTGFIFWRVLNLTDLNLWLALIIVTIVPGMFIAAGIDNDTVLDYIRYVINYYKKAKIYYYSK